MITVTAYGESYNCAKAVRGTDWIVLYDEAGQGIVSFGGISSMADYSIEGGEWSEPTPSTEELLDIILGVTGNE